MWRPLVSPSKRILPGWFPPTLHEGNYNGKPPGSLQPQFGAEALQPCVVHQLSINPGKAHGIPTPGEPPHIIIRKRKINHAPRAIHHVVVEIARQGLPPPERILVEVVVLRQQVVGSDHRCIATNVAITNESLLQHGNPLHSMISGEMVGRRQAMAACANHYDVISGLQALLAPKRAPVTVARQTGPQEGQGGISGLQSPELHTVL